MKITCPNCRVEIPAADIDIHHGIARCHDCMETFSFLQGMVAPTAAPGTVAAPPQKREVPQPPGVAMTHVMDDLIITRRWFNKSAFGLLFFCLIWDGIMAAIIISTMHSGGFPWLASPHVLAGVIITYVMLGMFVNSSEISVNDRTLTLRHFPLPWLGNMSIPVETIDQLFCTHTYAQRGRSGGNAYYSVNMLHKDGKAIVLVMNIEQPAQARFIEQEIERRLGIADRPIVGEVYTA